MPARVPTRGAGPVQADGFRSWLHEHPPGQRVGRAGKLDMCPLAAYLNATYPGPWGVCADLAWSCAPNSTAVEWRLPAWAQRFVRLTDARFGFDLGGFRGVTAQDALDVLDDVLAEEAD
jgi:hypothetical protein